MKRSSFIEKMLVISTAHLTHNSVKELDADIADRPDERSVLKWDAIIYPHATYGYLIHLSPDTPATGPLAKIDELARSIDCPWVLIDRDADQHPHLEAFDW
ncbi:MAG TPA: hypothetical protein P5256_00225 [Beijerinckiaceae bacterium]|nr:hypothetical protein [Rhodoblastus sp.]MCC2108469.1 hypothetical protein [Hyphomicrobiales bacterium]MCO5088731.1 hypothetical protein [Methylobacteriaceae bacterium]HRY01521.1 hypothetical protein [Beijerinckiaceae bacterium]MCB1533326.1 hypothetical protein [Rhodoblastus sp.]